MKNFGRRNRKKRPLTNRAEKRKSGSHLRDGLLTANVGLLLMLFSEWEALREEWHALLYIGGGTLCVAGIILVWIGVLNLAALGECLPRARRTNHPGEARQNQFGERSYKWWQGWQGQ
jgi:hypothetical protein